MKNGYSTYQNRSARRNIKQMRKRDYYLFAATALICLFLYSLSRGW